MLTNGAFEVTILRLHIAATLRHTVHLCLFQIESFGQGGFAHYGCDGENTLASHTGQNNIFFHGNIFNLSIINYQLSITFWLL